MKTSTVTIDSYISAFPKDVRKLLNAVRKAIKESAPDATEAISYQIPTFKLNGNLVHFAAFKKHIGFYPFPSGIRAFKKEAAEFGTSKGTIQFPYNKPLPLDLIKKIVRHRVKENLAKPQKD